MLLSVSTDLQAQADRHNIQDTILSDTLTIFLIFHSPNQLKIKYQALLIAKRGQQQ